MQLQRQLQQQQNLRTWSTRPNHFERLTATMPNLAVGGQSQPIARTDRLDHYTSGRHLVTRTQRRAATPAHESVDTGRRHGQTHSQMDTIQPRSSSAAMLHTRGQNAAARCKSRLPRLSAHHAPAGTEKERQPRTGCASGVMMLIKSSSRTSGSASRDSNQSLAVVQSLATQ